MVEHPTDTLSPLTESGSASLADVIVAVSGLGPAGREREGIALYEAWASANAGQPQVAIAIFNKACLQSQIGDVGAAIESLKAVLEINPDFAPAYVNLGGLVERAGSPANGIELWRAGAARLPMVTGASIDHKLALLKQITRVQSDLHRMAEAEATLREALALGQPHRDVVEQFVAMRMGQCKWPPIDPLEKLDRAAQLRGMHPLSVAAYTDDPLMQLGSAERYVRESIDHIPAPRDHDRRRASIEAGRRIRVGYVSSDLREHAVGHLMAELLELHDRARVEVFAYYCGVPADDPIHHRAKAAVEHWIDISSLTDDAAAAQIAADRIDVLVDLNGHTRSARTGVFSRRPAPIQVNWLGYPGTMASPYHHYIVADDWIIPPGQELYYSERVLRLACYQPNDRKRVVAAQRPSRAEAGLPEGATVFCCFNAPHKITHFTFGRWMEILRAVDGSVLWLLESDAEAQARLAEHAVSAGVDPSRLIFAPKLRNDLHLARYPLADLFLDTVPYGAHTTASDALWMGVPVLTLSGRSFAARVCGSLVRSAGLPDLVCERTADFVARGVELGRDRATLAALRARLEAARPDCDLFAMERLADRLEDLFAQMCDDHRRGDLPRPDLANLDDYLEAAIALDHDDREMLGEVDYHGLFRAALGLRHAARPIREDARLWTAEAIAESERPGSPSAHDDPFDIAMAELVARRPDSFFVQVGGFDGVSFDPLRPHVVAADLAGVIVEPIPQYFDKLQALYDGNPKVTPINCAVADEDGERTIWKFNPEAVERGLLPPHFAGISSFLMEDLLKETGVLGRSSPNAETTAALRALVQPVQVPCKTLDHLLSERGIERIDILQIDTEGYDFEVLKLFDFARFRPGVVHYEHQHLNGEDTAAAEALLRGHGYRISRQQFDTTAVFDTPEALAEVDRLRAMAAELASEGRAGEALLVLQKLHASRPSDVETLRALVRLLSSMGRVLEALERLIELKVAAGDPETVIEDVRAQALVAIERYNAHLAAGEMAQAEAYAAALAEVAPLSAPMVTAALVCNQALGRRDRVEHYARALLALDPADPAALAALAEVAPTSPGNSLDGEISEVLDPARDVHPLLRLRDIHDLASRILCAPLDAGGLARVRRLQDAARALVIELPVDSEWAGWAIHYRLMMDAVDLPAIEAPTPDAGHEAAAEIADSTGSPLAPGGLKGRADELGARAVFFAAADEAYVDLYARWYALSVLKYADVAAMVVIHVIGGAGRLAEIAAKVGVRDPRLMFTADAFDEAAVATKSYDAPPKGLADKPIAHLQSVRFLRLDGLLSALERPIFVSDIDLVLQRGVADLLDRTAGDDIVVNENEISWNAGSRLTANLLLVNPTANAHRFLRSLRAYLERHLAASAVTRWIDQAALLFARHHLERHGEAPRIGRFDTSSDINNVMYPSYRDHPFRFLSLFHGFDTSSLEALDLDRGPADRGSRRSA